ncbi:MAG TPA: hypothetical protein VGU71_13130 [Candidatus Dormibacteraeota bacterium]|nr:hypothetical protein [Candidatus Dormibacteraeota bacterium]
MRSANTTAKVRKAPRTRQTVVASVPDDLGVKREIRLALFEKAIDRLLSEGENRDFVIFEMRGSPDSYVQYMFHDGALLGEVGSGGWIPEGEVLEKERVAALGCLGFEGGGLRANFARDHLPQEARRLGCLTELLLGAAYQPPRDYDVTVLTKSLIETQAAAQHAREVDA